MPSSRRIFLQAAVAAGLSHTVAVAQDQKLVPHAWQRNPANPIFAPAENYDAGGCQGPCVVRQEDTYWLFYAGIERGGRQRICLATAAVDRPTVWKRLGPIFDLGGVGAFDERAATYPCVHRVGQRWHLYYTGRSTQEGPQHFANYRGLGLAVSENLRDWKKHSSEPVLAGDGC